MKNKIIILNGTSSSGKGSIVQEFQNLAKDCWYGFNMDGFNFMLPQRYLNFDPTKKLSEENKKGFYFDKDFNIHVGEYAKNISEDIIYVIKALADRNRNVIVDCVLFGLDDLKLFAKLLKNHNVYIVRVHCDADELDRRERERGDRVVGHAKKQQKLIDTKYNDLVLDTTHKTPEALAKELLDYVENNETRMLLELL